MDQMNSLVENMKNIEQEVAAIPSNLTNIFTVRADPLVKRIDALFAMYGDEAPSEAVLRGNALVAELGIVSDEFDAAGGTTEQWNVLCKASEYGLFGLPQPIADDLGAEYYAIAKEKTVREFEAIPGNLKDAFAAEVMPALGAFATFSQEHIFTSILDRKVLDEYMTRVEDIEARCNNFYAAGGTQNQCQTLVKAAEYGLFSPR